LRRIIEVYTKEAGVRKLEQKITEICRKAAMRVAQGENAKYTLQAQDLEAWLGCPKYSGGARNTQALPGVANGLAWTALGGDVMPVEALFMPGTGKVKLTGSLGEVMKESAEAAVSYLRHNARALELPDDFYAKQDVHIHLPEGATPKDGPSAGVTIFTALLSSLSRRACDPNVAMTGEITLTGRVMRIGGLKEKAMAAYKAGITTVLLPQENLPDLEEVDPAVKAHVRFCGVRHLSELPPLALAAQ
jgi:ATP-dependent Lon protease